MKEGRKPDYPEKTPGDELQIRILLISRARGVDIPALDDSSRIRTLSKINRATIQSYWN